MPLMLSFVALFFLSGDSWRLAGAISWWRLGAFVAVFALVYFGTLYRRAKRTVDQVLKHPIKVFDIPKKVRDDHPTIDRVFRTRIVGEKPGAPPGLLNLRVAAAILLTRRIVISGIIVSAALFLFGIILIGKQDTVALMNNPSPAVIGFTATFGIGKYQFFLSESLLKESLLLGALAAAYFVFANPEPDPGEKRDQDTLVVTFIRKIIALWACYQQLEVTGQSAQPAAGGTKQAAA